MTARPLSIADELAIRSMFARYVHLLDGGDAEGWANLFTADGRWTRLNSPPRELGGSGKLAMVGDYRLQITRTPLGWRIKSIDCDLVPKAD